MKRFFFLKDGDCRLTSVGENVAAILFNLQVTEGNLEKKTPQKNVQEKEKLIFPPKITYEPTLN